ncbi:MAG: c-type cytochrome [Alphaproteobacteria bacterium]|nr:c-type cytochrome [Alphaproteobacteria bacterium]
MVRILTRGGGALFVAVFAFLTAPSSFASGDATKGADLFKKKCFICHTSEKGGPNKIGPNLFGVVGRAAGSVSTYNYSTAMKNSGLTWTEANLTEYLIDPKKKVPGDKMSFAGFSDPTQAADVVAYLATLK